MTLREAITDGSIQLEVKRRLGKSYQADALKLLIEAGKRCLLAQKETSFVGPGLLPGQTIH